MKFYVLKCPHCGGQLDVEEGLKSFYCKYCGAKVIVDQSDLRVREMEHAEFMAEKELEHERILKIQQMKHDEAMKEKQARSDKWDAIQGIAWTIFMIFCLGVMAVLGIAKVFAK